MTNPMPSFADFAMWEFIGLTNTIVKRKGNPIDVGLPLHPERDS